MEMQSGAKLGLNAWFQSTSIFYTGYKSVKKQCNYLS